MTPETKNSLPQKPLSAIDTLVAAVLLVGAVVGALFYAL